MTWGLSWAAILGAAAIAYGTRAVGVHLGLRLPAGGTADRFLRALAPSLFAGLISLTLASGDWASWVGAGLCLALLAARLPALPVLAAAVAAVAGLRAWL